MRLLCRGHGSESIDDSDVEQANGDVRTAIGAGCVGLVLSRDVVDLNLTLNRTGPFSACMGIKPDFLASLAAATTIRRFE